jgi:hypothetical protein
LGGLTIAIINAQEEAYLLLRFLFVPHLRHCERSAAIQILCHSRENGNPKFLLFRHCEPLKMAWQSIFIVFSLLCLKFFVFLICGLLRRFTPRNDTNVIPAQAGIQSYCKPRSGEAI